MSLQNVACRATAGLNCNFCFCRNEIWWLPSFSNTTLQIFKILIICASVLWRRLFNEVTTTRWSPAGYKYQTWMCYKRKHYCSVCNMHQTYFFVQSYWHWIWDACIWGIYKTKFVHLVLLGNISVSLDIINTKRSPRVRGTACYAFGSSLHIMHIVHIHHIAYYAYQYWFDRIK